MIGILIVSSWSVTSTTGPLFRGDPLWAYSSTPTDDQLVFHANLDKVQVPKSKKAFTPSKMMLYDQDTSMLLQNPDDLNRIYRMDLERGQVVDEWTVHEDAPVTSIIPDTKYAQMTSNPTLIGLNQRSIFRIDPASARTEARRFGDEDVCHQE